MSKKQQFDHKDVEILSTETAFQGFFQVNKYTLRHRKFGGGWSDTIERDVFERGESTAALLFDPELEQVVLIEQFRPGALRSESGPWLFEIVAGAIDEGHSAVDVIKKEAMEEAGCEIVDLIPICDYFSTPGGVSERVALFCARVDASRAGGIHGLDAEHEDIRVFTLDVQEAFKEVTTGSIDNAASIIALQWLQLNYDSVRTHFGKK